MLLKQQAHARNKKAQIIKNIGFDKGAHTEIVDGIFGKVAFDKEYTEEHLVDKKSTREHREVYAHLIHQTLRNPIEVWEQIHEGKKGRNTKRIYLARYSLSKNKYINHIIVTSVVKNHEVFITNYTPKTTQMQAVRWGKRIKR